MILGEYPIVKYEINGNFADKMPVQTKAQVLALLQQYHPELQGRFGVQRCGVFGSFVRNTATVASDVDILVTFEPGQKTFDNFMHLSFFLEDIFERAVDLITTESLSPYVGSHILNEVGYVVLPP